MEQKTYWIIQTRKWKVNKKGKLTEIEVELIPKNLKPDWERTEVVIDTESMPKPKEA